MGKRRINQWIAPAYQVLITCGIAQDGVVPSAFRSQVSSFAAASIMGSITAAAAFFSTQGNSSIHRELLLSAMYCLVSGRYDIVEKPAVVFRYICNNQNSESHEDFLDAAVALKLAMNLFDLGKEDGNG